MSKLYQSPSGETSAVYQDALSQPHLLIAGATGSGKSVIINALIHSALLRFPFGDGGAQFILIDPKRVELSRWTGIPHTIYYASEPDTMLGALFCAMDICEARYRKMQTAGQKKFVGTDVYVIIDEFADLMTTQGRTVKPLVQRLAQIGRAARVHLIIATQTPIAKVIPTEIKCNFDSRFGLRARSAQDSRNILDHAGLELLPKYGQAVYMTPAGETLYNVPMVPEGELQRVRNWWAAQMPAPRKPSLLRRIFTK